MFSTGSLCSCTSNVVALPDRDGIRLYDRVTVYDDNAVLSKYFIILELTKKDNKVYERYSISPALPSRFFSAFGGPIGNYTRWTEVPLDPENVRTPDKYTFSSTTKVISDEGFVQFPQAAKIIEEREQR